MKRAARQPDSKCGIPRRSWPPFAIAKAESRPPSVAVIRAIGPHAAKIGRMVLMCVPLLGLCGRRGFFGAASRFPLRFGAADRLRARRCGRLASQPFSLACAGVRIGLGESGRRREGDRKNRESQARWSHRLSDQNDTLTAARNWRGAYRPVTSPYVELSCGRFGSKAPSGYCSGNSAAQRLSWAMAI